MRLTNIKVLSPSKLVNQNLVSIDLRNNRLSEIPDEITE
jgi:Leucine-rich repeat (LRR) protein